MEPNTSLPGWAIVEQMGHKTIAGFVSEVQLAGVPMLRIDVPAHDPEGDPVATQFIHASTLYALTPTAEAIVRQIAKRTRVEPAATWGLPRGLPEPEDIDVDDDEPEKVIDDLLVNHGLAGVLELIADNYRHVPEPDSDRCVAILEHAKELVDADGRWPERTAEAIQPPPVEIAPPPCSACDGTGGSGPSDQCPACNGTGVTQPAATATVS